MYTGGLKTEEGHVLSRVEVKRLRRGGSVTLHNPGQLVFYTVVPLEMITCSLEGYIRFLEGVGAAFVGGFGVEAFPGTEHTGVWTRRGKIGFIGIGARRGAIYHGMAINIQNDLRDYDAILSCGLTDPVSRLIDEKMAAPAAEYSLEELSERLRVLYMEMVGSILAR